MRPVVRIPASREFKIGTLDGCLGKQSDPAAFDIAKQIGFDGVQIDMGGARNNMHLRWPEVQKQFLEAAKRTGLEIASMTISKMLDVPLQARSTGGDLAGPERGHLQGPGAQGRAGPAVQRRRIGPEQAGRNRPLRPGAEGSGPKGPAGRRHLQPGELPHARDNLRIIERIGSPAVKVYYNVGNSTDKHYNIYKEIPLLGDLICEFHFKDGQFMLGRGRIDFQRVRRAWTRSTIAVGFKSKLAAARGRRGLRDRPAILARAVSPPGRLMGFDVTIQPMK